MSKKDFKNTSRTDWEALENMSDEDIDYSDIPPLTDDFDLEIAQTRKNERLMEYLEQSSSEEAVFSLDDVKQELGLD